MPQPASPLPRSLRWLAALLVLGLLVPLALPGSPARAEEGAVLTEEEEERLEAVERHTDRGVKAFRSGNYEEVRARMRRLEKYAPDDPLPAYLLTRVDLRTGKYDEALARISQAVKEHPADKRLEAAHFRTLLQLGKTAELRAVADAAVAVDEKDGMAWAARGLALEERGVREEALVAYERSIGTYDRKRSSPEDLPWIARAAIQATWLSPNPKDDLLEAGGKLLTRSLQENPDDQDALLIIGDLYQEQRGPKGQALASKYYKQLLKDNPEVPDARVGLARKLLLFYQQDGAMRELGRALNTNPKHVPALALLAAIHVGDGDYDKATKLLDRALKVSPTDKKTRAVKAALLWITGDKEAYEALEKEILAWDPTYGELYITISDLVGERQRRYDVAAEFARKAIAIDEHDPISYTVLGEALMNLGLTDEARENFNIAVDKSKRYKDVKRDNWRNVLDIIDDFRTTESEHFIVRMHPSESDVMVRYLLPLLEDSWETLSKKYGMIPEVPVRVDSFHWAEDFSVRSVGVAGLPALGVCFGNVITLLGPTSRPVGSFSWARTAWHEFAHVITLGLSKGQVPRWLTEGLSVYEEKMRRSNWSREMERMLYDRYHNDRLLRMDKINSAFRGPDIGFAYYQGGLIAEHLTETRGFEVIPKMLQAFAEDRTTAQVFKDVLDLDLADYDRQFRAFVHGIVKDYRIAPRWDKTSFQAFQDRVKKDPSDGEAWVRLAWAHLQRGQKIDAAAKLGRALALIPDDPEVVLLQGRLAQADGRADLAVKAYERYLAMGEDDLETRLFLAQRLMQGGNDSAGAIIHLEAAKKCFPYLVGKSSPYLLLSMLYRGGGDVEKAVGEMEAYASIAGEDYGVRKELKAWYREKDDAEKVVKLCEEMVDINPFGAVRNKPADLELHRDYAWALKKLGREEEALRELEVQVALLGTVDEEARIAGGAVDDHLELGDAYLEAKRPIDALEQAIAALRLSPENADARMLKLRAEEAAGYR